MNSLTHESFTNHKRKIMQNSCLDRSAPSSMPTKGPLASGRESVRAWHRGLARLAAGLPASATHTPLCLDAGPLVAPGCGAACAGRTCAVAPSHRNADVSRQLCRGAARTLLAHTSIYAREKEMICTRKRMRGRRWVDWVGGRGRDMGERGKGHRSRWRHEL
jgi:hypothetical protein